MSERGWIADALVIFGITGDLGRKMTFPALYRLEQRGALTCPVVGVASTALTMAGLMDRAREAVEESGEQIAEPVFARLARRLTYLSGDVTDAQLYKALSVQLSGARRPLYYLEMPPSLFAPIVDRLDAAGLLGDARVAVEKPFGHDLSSARELSARLHQVLDARQLLLAQTDLPLDDNGRLPCNPDLTVRGVDGVFAAGDCAAVPDLTRIAQDPDAMCAPSAQHAVRQAKRLAADILATVNDRPRRDYEHAYAGSVASLGLYRGVAEIYGVKLRGILAWFMHRTYHVTRMPTFNRKVRVLVDWTTALFFRREVVSLGQLQQPRTEFEIAAGKRGVP